MTKSGKNKIMNSHADKTHKDKSQSLTNSVSKKQNSGASAFQFEDNRPEAIIQKRLMKNISNSQPLQLQKLSSQVSQTSDSDKKNSSQGVIQLMKPEELTHFGEEQAGFMAKVKPPTAGMNVWSVQFPIDLGPPDHIDGTATLYILGTQHSTRFGQIEHANPLLQFLTTTHWNEVFTEIGETGLPFKAVPASMAEALNVEVEAKANPEKAARHRLVAGRKIKNYDEAATAIATPIDEAASRLAVNGAVERSSALETDADRTHAVHTNKSDGANRLPDLQQDRFSPQQTHTIAEAYKQGNEHKIWEFQQDSLKEGRDIQDTEERNKRWLASQHGRLSGLKDGEKILWIVGASHVPGLLTRLNKKFPGSHIRSVGGIHDEDQVKGPKHPYGEPQKAFK
ncbi:MAG: hypothetical protein ACI8ZM_002701 [Crocinitomix sp.]